MTKCLTLASSCDVDTDCPPSLKKRVLIVSKVQKWIAENDKALDTATCLKYDTSGRYHVQALLDYCIDSLNRKFDLTYF